MTVPALGATTGLVDSPDETSFGRRTMMRSPLCIVSALLLASCTDDGAPPSQNGRLPAGLLSMDTLPNGAVHVVSSSEGAWSHLGREPWRLEEDLRIGVVEGDENYMFGSLRSVIPTADGRIWALDSQTFQLRLYDQDGAFIRAVGGGGQGPGEFGFNPCAFPGPDGEIWVEAGGRWQWFDTEGELLGQQEVTRNLGCGIQGWMSDDRFAAVHVETNPATRERESLFLIHHREPSGRVAVRDTAHVPTLPEATTVTWFDGEGRARITLHMPLVHRASYVLDSKGDFWISEGGGHYRIRRQTLFGDTLIIMERPYEPIPVPDSVRDEAMPERRRGNMTLDRRFNPGDVPRVFPPFDGLLVGTDGTLWVRRQLEGGVYGLDVFAPDGRFLGQVEAPPEFGRMNIQYVTPDHMHGMVRDDMDVHYLVRLAIRKPEG
jgi:hypothetical protein